MPATGAIIFDGLFCIYTYPASTMAAVTGASAATVPLAPAVSGVGHDAGHYRLRLGARTGR